VLRDLGILTPNNSTLGNRSRLRLHSYVGVTKGADSFCKRTPLSCTKGGTEDHGREIPDPPGGPFKSTLLTSPGPVDIVTSFQTQDALAPRGAGLERSGIDMACSPHWASGLRGCLLPPLPPHSQLVPAFCPFASISSSLGPHPEPLSRSSIQALLSPYGKEPQAPALASGLHTHCPFFSHLLEPSMIKWSSLKFQTLPQLTSA
jgi:hypothetical protein